MRMGERLGWVVGGNAGDRDPAGQFAEKEFFQDVVTAQKAAEDGHAGLGRGGRSWEGRVLKRWQRNRWCRYRVLPESLYLSEENVV